MSNYKKQVKDSRQERERNLVLRHKVMTRITNVRMGKAAFQTGDFITAIRKYSEYLETMAELHKAAGMFELHPNHFNKNQDLTEMMMISHIYFELAKVYDATGKFQDECGNCLDQFVLFSANQPYQVVNSEMIRKHIRKFQFKNKEKFQLAYQQIFVQSRKCYVATFCFGDQHPVTEDLRRFKQWLLRQPTGELLVATYYSLSSRLVVWLPKHPLLAGFFIKVTSPLLAWFSRKPLARILNP